MSNKTYAQELIEMLLDIFRGQEWGMEQIFRVQEIADAYGFEIDEDGYLVK